MIDKFKIKMIKNKAEKVADWFDLAKINIQDEEDFRENIDGHWVGMYWKTVELPTQELQFDQVNRGYTTGFQLTRDFLDDIILNDCKLYSSVYLRIDSPTDF